VWTKNVLAQSSQTSVSIHTRRARVMDFRGEVMCGVNSSRVAERLSPGFSASHLSILYRFSYINDEWQELFNCTVPRPPRPHGFLHEVSGAAGLKHGTSAALASLYPLFVSATRCSAVAAASVARVLSFCFVLFPFSICVARVKARTNARCLLGWEWVRNWSGRIECRD